MSCIPVFFLHSIDICYRFLFCCNWCNMSEVSNGKVIYEGGSGEIEEKKSRFIANIAPVTTEEEAVAYINAMKKKYWDARHNCSWFLPIINAEQLCIAENYGKLLTDHSTFGSELFFLPGGTLLSIIFCKTQLICFFLAAVVGICAGIGIFKGIIDSAPDIDDIDASPTGQLSTVLDDEGNEIADQ